MANQWKNDEEFLAIDFDQVYPDNVPKGFDYYQYWRNPNEKKNANLYKKVNPKLGKELSKHGKYINSDGKKIKYDPNATYWDLELVTDPKIINAYVNTEKWRNENKQKQQALRNQQKVTQEPIQESTNQEEYTPEIITMNYPGAIATSQTDSRIIQNQENYDTRQLQRNPEASVLDQQNIGRNYSEAYEEAYNELGDNPLNWPEKSGLYAGGRNADYWDGEIHKAIKEGGDIAAAFAASPFAAYIAVESLPYVLTALKYAGQAMTPSTWLAGISQSMGYQLPTWIGTGADLALSAKFAYDAGQEFDENGLTWETAFNVLMSMVPFTRDEQAVDAVVTGIRDIIKNTQKLGEEYARVKGKYKLAYELRKSIKDTDLINVNIEHVSPNKITTKPEINDQGFHMSSSNSQTTRNIQAQNPEYNNVYEGVWTYSENTAPVTMEDVGYFHTPENTVNGKYTNNFEGTGETSYVTYDPNSVVLSKNEHISVSEPSYAIINGRDSNTGKGINQDISPRDRAIWQDIPDLVTDFQGSQYGDACIFKFPGEGAYRLEKNLDGSYTLIRNDFNTKTSTEQKFSSFEDVKSEIKRKHDELLNSDNPIQREIFKQADQTEFWGIDEVTKKEILPIDFKNYESTMNTLKDELGVAIDQIYKSPEYKERFLQFFSEDEYNQFLKELDEVYRKTETIIYENRKFPTEYGTSIFDPNRSKYIAGLNGQSESPEDALIYTLLHEFGHLRSTHAQYVNDYYKWLSNSSRNHFPMLTKVRMHNHELLKDVQLNYFGKTAPLDYQKYIKDPEEAARKIMSLYERELLEGIPAEESIYDDFANKVGTQYYVTDWIKKKLPYVLTFGPLINQILNNDSTDR